MQPAGSLLCSQEFTACPYLKPDRYNPFCPQTTSLKSILMFVSNYV
jgi:hypothetical protein